jgi:hypothetical protein
MTVTISPPYVSSDQALKTAEADANTAYQDLSRFRIEITLEDDGWHIKYRIRQMNGSRFLTGGGPHYVIDATTGAIVSAKYYQ